ncbi:MAG: FecR domain-containing protein [Candidatus Riflebacteria bacterium]|nr:FecR domain-containing protein [Candidatus Riflebacteria bacterium]
MSCEKARKVIMDSSGVTETLDFATRAHLQTCKACSAEMKMLASLHSYNGSFVSPSDFPKYSEIRKNLHNKLSTASLKKTLKPEKSIWDGFKTYLGYFVAPIVMIAAMGIFLENVVEEKKYIPQPHPALQDASYYHISVTKGNEPLMKFGMPEKRPIGQMLTLSDEESARILLADGTKLRFKGPATLRIENKAVAVFSGKIMFEVPPASDKNHFKVYTLKKVPTYIQVPLEGAVFIANITNEGDGFEVASGTLKVDSEKLKETNYINADKIPQGIRRDLMFRNFGPVKDPNNP